MLMSPYSHIVAQGIHLARNTSSVEAITGRMPDGVVAEMWDLLGFDTSRVHHKESIGAKEVIFGCRTPLSHPWLSLRSLETLGLNNTRVPLEERKKVCYYIFRRARFPTLTVVNDFLKPLDRLFQSFSRRR